MVSTTWYLNQQRETKRELARKRRNNQPSLFVVLVCSNSRLLKPMIWTFHFRNFGNARDVARTLNQSATTLCWFHVTRSVNLHWIPIQDSVTTGKPNVHLTNTEVKRLRLWIFREDNIPIPGICLLNDLDGCSVFLLGEVIKYYCCIVLHMRTY